MKKHKILILSNFGYESGIIGGQTVKVEHIYKLFDRKKKYYDFSLNYFDTDVFKNRFLIFKNIIVLFLSLINSNTLIFVGSKNNLKYLFPFLYCICFIFNVKIHYVVVGGWLSDFLSSNPLFVYFLRRINSIYPENHKLCDELKNNFFLNNVVQLNNFRLVDNQVDSIVQLNPNSDIKLVFMARVSPHKGVDTIFSLGERLQSESLDNISIDIYGPIEKGYEEKFNDMLQKAPKFIQYKGVIEPQKVYGVLRNYNVMLFPTKYSGEGFPGTVLDAYISGLPIIASGWQYASEFIVNGENGFITEFGNDQDFIEKTLSLLDQPELINSLSLGAFKHKEKYDPEIAWKLFEKNIFNSNSV